MASELGNLLIELDSRSKGTLNGNFNNMASMPLGAFSESLRTYQRIEDLIKGANLTVVESELVGKFYSVFAWRLARSTTTYDQEKFDKSLDIVDRAYHASMGGEAAVPAARRNIQNYMAQFLSGPEKTKKQLTAAFDMLEGWSQNEFLRLILHNGGGRIRYITRQSADDYGGRFNKFKMEVSEFGREAGIMFLNMFTLGFSFSGSYYLIKGLAEGSIVDSIFGGLEICLGLGPQIYRGRSYERQVYNVIGAYPIPTLGSVKNSLKPLIQVQNSL